MASPFFLAPAARLALNLLATFLYWNYTGFCCCDWQSAALSRRATAWLFIAASVVFLSQKDLTPPFTDINEKLQPIFNICAVVLCVHMFYCFLWLEVLTLLSTSLCFVGRTMKRIGLGILLDNKLITLRREGGYINVYTFMAFMLLFLAVISWYKMVVEMEEFDRWASCDLHRVGMSVERQLMRAEGDDQENSCLQCDPNERRNPRRRR